MYCGPKKFGPQFFLDLVFLALKFFWALKFLETKFLGWADSQICLRIGSHKNYTAYVLGLKMGYCQLITLALSVRFGAQS